MTDDVFTATTETEEMVTLIELDNLDKYNLISNLYWLIEMCMDTSINYTVTRETFSPPSAAQNDDA